MPAAKTLFTQVILTPLKARFGIKRSKHNPSELTFPVVDDPESCLAPWNVDGDDSSILMAEQKRLVSFVRSGCDGI